MEVHTKRDLIHVRSHPHTRRHAASSAAYQKLHYGSKKVKLERNMKFVGAKPKTVLCPRRSTSAALLNREKYWQ